MEISKVVAFMDFPSVVWSVWLIDCQDTCFAIDDIKVKSIKTKEKLGNFTKKYHDILNVFERFHNDLAILHQLIDSNNP